jgi:hypothetical protein
VVTWAGKAVAPVTERECDAEVHGVGGMLKDSLVRRDKTDVSFFKRYGWFGCDGRDRVL